MSPKWAMTNWLLSLCVCVAAAMLFASGVASADSKSDTTDTAVRLLKTSMQVSSDGRHNITLRALRQLQDPALEPYFDTLAKSEHPALKIHGLLGIAECRPDHKLDLARLAAIESAAVQAEVVTAAMDSKLLTTAQCQEIVAWKGIDPGVKVIVAADLMHQKQPVPMEILKEAAKADNIARRGMANLLLTQLGDADAPKALQEIVSSTDPRKDATIEMMLQSVMQYELDRAAPWVMTLVGDAKANPRMAVFALRTALRINAPGAAESWRQQYASNDDPSQRTRLALVALQASPWVAPKLFDPLKTSEESLIKRIGAAGAAIASRKDVGKAVSELVGMQHAIVNGWIVTYASRYAEPADRREIALALIRTSVTGPDRGRAERLDDAVSATELLVEKDAADAAAMLKPILIDPKTEGLLCRIVMLGLVRSQTGGAIKVVEGIDRVPDSQANDFLLVLRAKHGQPLSPGDLNLLSLLVRGAGDPPHSVRIQAAWAYLKITKQEKTAMQQVLGKAK